MSEITALLAPHLAQYSLAQIARVAGMHPNHLSNLMAGRRLANRQTLNKIRFAVARLKLRQTEASTANSALYRALLSQASAALKLNAATVQDSVPGAKKTTNQDWRDASFARWLAQYLMNVGLGFEQADVGRASGVTRQAVSLAMPEIEAKRDDPAFDALLCGLEDGLLGAAP